MAQVPYQRPPVQPGFFGIQYENVRGHVRHGPNRRRRVHVLVDSGAKEAQPLRDTLAEPTNTGCYRDGCGFPARRQDILIHAAIVWLR